MLEAPWVGVAAKEAAKKDEHRKTAVELAPVGGVNSTSIPTLCPRQSNPLCHMSQSPLSAVCCWTAPVFIMFQISLLFGLRDSAVGVLSLFSAFSGLLCGII